MTDERAIASASAEDHTLVHISEERLRALEALEAEMPSRIETAVKEYKLNALKRLHERDKQNPAAVNLRAKRYAERHREEINARRRAKRAEKKMLEAQVRVATVSSAAAAAPAELRTRIVRSTLAATLRRRAAAAVPAPAESTIVGFVGSLESSAGSTAAASAAQPCPIGQVLVRFDM